MSEVKLWLELGKDILKKLKESRNKILFACKFLKEEFKRNFNGRLSAASAYGCILLSREWCD